MSTINDSDLLLVERNGNLHQITYDQMSTLNDDDILLVERGGVQYKVEAQYVSTGPNGVIVTPVEVLTPINGAGITEFNQYEPLSSAITAVGGGGTFDRATDEIQSVADVSNWNQSQTWSSGTYTGSQPPASNYAVEYAFNENGEDGGSFGPGDYWAIEAGGEATLTFSSPITLSSNSTVEILGANYEWVAPNGGGMTFTCSNGSVPVTLNAVNNAVVKTTISDAYTTFGSQITAITLTAASNGWMSLVGLFVDGKRLVDAGIAGATITGKLLSFPTNTNFGEFQVNQRISDYTTFNPDSGNQNGGVLSDDNLTISAENTQYIERRSKQTAFNAETTYIEFTVSGSGLRGGIGVGDSDALVISGEGSFVVYRENGDVIKYPGNTHVFTLQPWSDGDVIGVRLTNYNNNPTVGFSKNGQSMGSVGMSQYSFTTDLFAHAGIFPNGSASITANFGSSPFVHTPTQGFDGLNPNVIIQDIDASATPPTITVSGGTWDDSNKSQFWSGNVSGNLFEPAYPMSKAFNGVLTFNNNAFAEMNNTATLTFPGAPISFTTLRVYAQKYATSSTPTFFVNGTDYTSQLGGSGNTSLGWYTITGETELTSIGLGSYNGASDATGLYAVEVDGKILVDGFEDSQVWSDGTYTGTAPNDNYGVEDLFANAGKEGDAFGANKLWGLYQATGSFALDNPIPLTSTSTLELITYQSNQGSTGTLTLTGPGGSVQAPLAINNVNVLGKTTVVNPYASLGDSITSITIAASGNDWTALESIYVDGKPVIDAGTRDLGQTSISTTVSYEKSLTFTDTTELANMVAPLEMADATGGNSLIPTTSNVVSSSFSPAQSFFNTTLYTGNASGAVQTFDTSVDMQNNGGMIWFKSRQHSQAARIIDTYRGTRPTLIPSSNTGNNALGADGLTFLDDGFSIGWDGNDIASSYNYVAWSFAEKPGFFDIVTWDGNYTNREIAHNLGSVPGFIMVKRTSANEDWTCYHKSLGADTFIQLNSANASSGLGSFMNNTEPTSTHFTIGTHDRVNTPGHSYIAYIFADNPSNQIKCGSYTGTGPDMTVDVGFRPHWVMLKSSSNSSTNWVIADSSRPNEVLWPNSSDAAYPHSVSFTDTGFTLESNSSYMNTSGYDYIYIAIGEVGDPAQTEITFQDNTALNALTSGMTIASNGGMLSVPTFSVDTYTGNNGTQLIDNGIDLAGEGGLTWVKYRAGQFGTGHYMFDTERGNSSIYSNTNDHEYSPDNRLTFDSSGFNVSTDGGSATNATDYPYVAWSFRKEPGFFDIVKFWGNGENGRAIPHNLGTAPAFIMLKNISLNENWMCYHKDAGLDGLDAHERFLQINYDTVPFPDSPSSTPSSAWGNTAPDENNFYVGGSVNSNSSGSQFVAYLFADNPSNGIKCGGYTGTGADNNNIDCGFEPTWVMIKNIDESGASNNNKSDWYICDHKRGFSSHYGSMTGKSLSANTNAGDKSDATIVVSSTGFKPATGGEEYGKSGIKYIYIAIGSPTASGGPAVGTLITDADPSTNKVSVDTTSWPTDYTVTGPTLSASLTSILEVSGNTIFGNGSNGSWVPGYYAEGSEINAAPPGPSEITFTSQNQGTPAFSGVDATLASRTWTLESGTTATGPWTLVDSYVDYDVLNSQDGSTPWTSNKPTLQPNTYYRIKVQYDSTNAESVESVYHTFKTGDA